MKDKVAVATGRVGIIRRTIPLRSPKEAAFQTVVNLGFIGGKKVVEKIDSTNGEAISAKLKES